MKFTTKYRKLLAKHEALVAKYSELDGITMALASAAYDTSESERWDETNEALRALDRLDADGTCLACGCAEKDAMFGSFIDGGDFDGWCLTCRDRQVDLDAHEDDFTEREYRNERSRFTGA